MAIRSLPALLSVLLALLLDTSSGRAQLPDPMTAGRTYVIAYPDTTQNAVDARFADPAGDTIAMYIYSPVATVARISGNGYLNTVHVQPHQFTTVYLNDASLKAANPIAWQSNIESRNVFRVEADAPVIIYCYIATRFGCAAWTPLPVEAWGREYYAAANDPEIVQDISTVNSVSYRAKNRAAPAEACVISAYDNTTVTITPSLHQRTDNLPDWVGFPEMTITLNADRAYQVQSFIDTLTANFGTKQPEIAGVYIRSDRPIGVISGNTRARLNPFDSSVKSLEGNSRRDLTLEQIAPVEQHGRTFVYTPTVDDRLLLWQPGEQAVEKRRGEIVRIYATNDTNNGRVQGDTLVAGGAETLFALGDDEVWQHDVPGGLLALVYHTSSPAQGFKSALSAARTVTASPDNQRHYQTWGTYMVEMTPREQWTWFAPYIAPAYPDSMRHYVNLITDTLSTMRIRDESGSLMSGWRRIPGSDLCWLSRSVTPDVTHLFVGADTSVRFCAFAYGLKSGWERLMASSPLGYSQRSAPAYGYPVSPRRAVLRQPDSLRIDITQTCDSMVVVLHALNTVGTVGFRSIALDSGAVNTKLTFTSPTRAGDIIGRDSARLKVTAVDKLFNASGALIITDRTGKRHVIPYSYEAERVEFTPAGRIDFGSVMMGTEVDTLLTITNPLRDTARVRDISLYFRGAQPFTIIEPSPLPTSQTPLTLPPGDSISVRVRFSPTSDDLYADTLRVQLECATARLPLVGRQVPAGVDWSTIAASEPRIHPTPSGGRADLHLDLKRPTPVEIVLLDAGGVAVMQQSWSAQAGRSEHALDLSGLVAGVYYCRVSAGGSVSVVRVVVVR